MTVSCDMLFVSLCRRHHSTMAASKTILFVLLCVSELIRETHTQFNPALSNTVVVQGQTAVFHCGATTDVLGRSLYWSECSSSSPSCPLVGADADKDPAYAAAQPVRAARYTLAATAVDKQYEWSIASVSHVDKGQYKCWLTAVAEDISFAELIILAGNPLYTRNTSNSDHQAVEGDIIKMTAEVSYHGRWGPVTSWAGPDLGPVTDESTPGVAKYSVSVTVSRALEGHTWTATTNFDKPSSVNPGEADNAPSYTHSYQYAGLMVEYGPSVPTFSPAGPYYPGQEVTCEANGKPVPTFRWIDLSTTATVTSGPDLLIKTEWLGGSHRFQCEASNTDFRGQLHTSTVDNEFQVITTTSLPTTVAKTTITDAASVTLDGNNTGTPCAEAGSGISGGEIAGIIVLIVVFVVLAVVVTFVLLQIRIISSNKNKDN